MCTDVINVLQLLMVNHACQNVPSCMPHSMKLALSSKQCHFVHIHNSEIQEHMSAY